MSKTPQPPLSAPACRSLEPEPLQSTPRSYSINRALLPDLPIAATDPYSERHPSHPSSIFTSPNQGTPGPSLAGGYLPPPLDPVQTQQVHYFLAQAMQQLAYSVSATMPSYSPYASNPGQPWHHPPPPFPPHAATPIHQPSQFQDTRPYHTPSSSISRSELPPSSPMQFSVSPLEERRACSRGRSKSRGRRVSFKLDSEDVACSREHDTQPEVHHSGQKIRKQILGGKREGGKERSTEEFDDAFRLEDRGSPPQEVARGRTPGPPSRQKNDISRGRSLSRR